MLKQIRYKTYWYPKGKITNKANREQQHSNKGSRSNQRGSWELSPESRVSQHITLDLASIINPTTNHMINLCTWRRCVSSQENLDYCYREQKVRSSQVVAQWTQDPPVCNEIKTPCHAHLSRLCKYLNRGVITLVGNGLFPIINWCGPGPPAWIRLRSGGIDGQDWPYQRSVQYSLLYSLNFRHVELHCQEWLGQYQERKIVMYDNNNNNNNNNNHGILRKGHGKMHWQ